MSAFDDIERTDIEPASHLIGQFEYLNASGRAEAARVRNAIDEMILRYPEVDRLNLVRRLRSRDDGLHRGAAFELMMHEILVRQGFRILQVEPVVANGRSPDFLVEAPDGTQFYLEATLAMGAVAADAGAERRKRDALQAIDDVVSPDFFLSVDTHGFPATQVPVGRLRRQVQQFVDGLSYEEVLAALNADRALPTLDFSHEGFDVEIGVVPKRLRGRTGRAIATRNLPGGLVTPHEAIKTAVEGKASRYGQLDRPYVVAVNAMEEFAHEESAIDAAFGTEAVAFRRDGQHRWVRNPDGVWYGREGPTHTRVSAIISTERLSPWSLGQRPVRLIINPWAVRCHPDAGWNGDKFAVKDERLLVRGSSIRQILNLPEGWPEG